MRHFSCARESDRTLAEHTFWICIKSRVILKNCKLLQKFAWFRNHFCNRKNHEIPEVLPSGKRQAAQLERSFEQRSNSQFVLGEVRPSLSWDSATSLQSVFQYIWRTAVNKCTGSEIQKLLNLFPTHAKTGFYLHTLILLHLRLPSTTWCFMRTKRQDCQKFFTSVDTSMQEARTPIF